MTDKAGVQSVIERLEKAEGGSRDLDAKIFVLCAEMPAWLKARASAKMWARGIDVFWSGGGVTQGPLHINGETPHYTTSIDAALTLVPREWYVDGICEACGTEKHDSWGASLRHPDMRRVLSGPIGVKTAAIALCIAALKSRSQP